FNQSQFNIKPQPAVAPVFAPILPKPDASSAQNGAENAAAQSPKKVRAIKPKVEEESVSASTQSKIDATIDDFMKKYKMKDLSASESEPADDDDDNDDDKKDSDFDASDSKDDEGRVEHPKKSRSKKKKEQGDAQVDATRKKRKYTRKKIKNLPQNESTQDTTATVETVQPDYYGGGGDDEKKSRKKDSSFVVSAASRARRKSAFVKLMQKNKRKKRKKTSSDEEAESDDSDGFELSPAVVSRAKREEINSQEDTTNGAAGDEVQSDETTAKLLQAGEKRRSTRCVKRQKYSDTAIKDEDLLLPAPPPSNDDQVAESSQKKGNIEFATSDTLVVDKILGIRLFKRKTRRRIEKTSNETGEKAQGEREPVESGDDKMELSEAAVAAATVATAGEENKENLEESKSEERSEKKENDDQEELEEEASEYETDGELEVEEFYVKYKNLSYLHCEWRSRDELFYSDKRIDQKIKRFRVKKQQSQVYDWDDPDTNNSHNGYNNDYDELFNPDYVIIDRILDEYEADDLQKPGNRLKYFLVKWKALAYDESSWELESDIKNVKKIERFRQINTMVADIHLKHVCKPKVDRWNKLSQSRIYKNDNRIREYQLEGINWLIFCWLNGRNCILADEMGLGKTVQSITFLQEVAYYGITGPSLILVPLSTIGNWIREFETWTDFNVIVYHGSTISRQMIQDYEFYFKEADGSKSKKIVKFNALITTYEVLMSDVPLFCSFKWRNLIIDEAHRLKNKNCKLIEGLRYMDIEHKVLLTGTPLQNNVEELFSLLNFLEPQQFHSSAEFMQEYGELKTDVQVQSLQAVLKPMMLRRLKEDVEKNLKPKEETIVEVELTNTQKKYYRAILERNFQFLTRGASSANVPNLMNTMMELRKCCNHPYLIDGAEDQIIAEYMERYRIENQERASLQAMVQASGKLVLVDKLLPKLKAGGHRVLIFSQMIRVLDILEDYLIQMRFTYERLDGRIRGEARQEAIDRYSKPDSDRFAFLLCTRAGGLGINLTAADTVIIYDSDWNPQNDLQAQARVHRIGQQKSVKIYRLVTRNTYEREMFDRASLKLGLDKAIL
ncbi:chromodomain-helicase-DNA-binding, partial [Brachionus plicatilis]